MIRGLIIFMGGIKVLLGVFIIGMGILYSAEIGGWISDRWGAAASRFDHIIGYGEQG